MEGITLLLTVSSFLIALSLYKKDYAILFLSSTLYILAGLFVIRNGLLDLGSSLSPAIGLIFLFLGIYFIFRSTIELFKENKSSEDKTRR